MKSITISKGQYISEIEPFKSTGIPTNSIWHKTITGCGITTFEIQYAKHHSIIIEPNVPVIKEKEQEHNEKYPAQKVLGVYKGVETDDIRAYLLSEVTYKKIITTPEGFKKKVLKAFSKDIEQMTQNYFLLYDECERIITDVRYRGEIAAPLDIFFEFKNKAMVSATTLAFTDKRFDTFEKFIIAPDYDFSQSINLIESNSVMASLIKHLERIQSSHINIFINSTSGISAIINNLGIEAESRVFCALDSVVKLMERGHKCATTEFDISKLAKYNFFTSRYFSAMSIKLSFKPDVIMVTDVYFADHSILDPHTECIQIPGRFRNGISSLAHISNFNPNLKAKSEDEALYYLEGCFDTYNGFVKSHAKATNPGSKDAFAKAIECCIAHSFYDDGILNDSMVANYIHEERVKGYYQTVDKLKAAYALKPLHFKITNVKEEYSVGDDDLYNLRTRQTAKERHKVVAHLLNKWTSTHDNFVIPPYEMLNRVRANHPTIAQAFDVIGLKGLEETEYVTSAINKAVKETRKMNEIARVAPFVYCYLKANSTINEVEVGDKIANAYTEAKTAMKPTSAQALLYFEGRRSTARGKNVSILGDKKFP